MSNFVVITAPSASGKTTLIKRYIEEHKSDVYFGVSHTTRVIRNGEIDGVDYYFISREEFQKKIEAGEFIEWALVHNNLYGTSFVEIKKACDNNKVFILDIDVQGAINLIKQGVKAKYIFIMPPSIEELKRRLIARSTDTEEMMKCRVENARKEITHSKDFEYVILNDNLENAYKELCNIID